MKDYKSQTSNPRITSDIINFCDASFRSDVQPYRPEFFEFALDALEEIFHIFLCFESGFEQPFPLLFHLLDTLDDECLSTPHTLEFVTWSLALAPQTLNRANRSDLVFRDIDAVCTSDFPRCIFRKNKLR